MNQAVGVLQSLTLGEPLVLWLFVLAVPAVVLAPSVRLRATPRVLRVGVLAIRLTIVGLLLFAVAEPRLRPAGHARAVVFALDVSDSLSPDQQAWARKWVERAIRALPPGSHSDTIEFAERAQLGDEDPSVADVLDPVVHRVRDPKSTRAITEQSPGGAELTVRCALNAEHRNAGTGGWIGTRAPQHPPRRCQPMSRCRTCRCRPRASGRQP